MTGGKATDADGDSPASAPGPTDWSCEHGGRWLRWTGGWMQVVAPMTLNQDGAVESICACEPPGAGPKQPAVPNLGEGDGYPGPWDDPELSEDDEYDEFEEDAG